MKNELLSITVNPQGESGFYSVIASWRDHQGLIRTTGVACAFSEIPSVICELAHEMTGSAILASDGALG